MTASAGFASPRTNIAGYKLRQVPNFTPGQMQLFERLLGGITGGTGLTGGMDLLSRLAGGDEAAFAGLEAPAYSSFQKSLGQIGSRFAGLGALDSSGFQQATSGAAKDLAENLQAQRLGLQQGAIERLLGLSSNLLGQKPYSTFLEPEREGFDWEGLLGGIGGPIFGPLAGVLGKGLGKAALPKLLKLFGLGQ